MKTPDWSALNPPGRSGETVAWCPLCGEVIIRRDPDDQRPPMALSVAEEEVARDHMLVRHELEPDAALATLTKAVRQ